MRLKGLYQLSLIAICSALLWSSWGLPVRAQAGQSIHSIEKVPYIDRKGQSAWNSFRRQKRHRVFAISPSGSWAWSTNRSRYDAEQRALHRCNSHSSSPCRLFAVNSEVLWESRPDDEAIFKSVTDGNRFSPLSEDQVSSAVLGYKTGNRFPDLMLESEKGERFRLASLKGRAVFLKFGASWCPYCVGHVPVIAKLREAFRGNESIRWLALPVKESPEAMAHWLRTSDVDLEVCDGPVEGRWLRPENGPDISMHAPRYFLIDNNGIIRAVRGSGWALEDAVREMQDLSALAG